MNVNSAIPNYRINNSDGLRSYSTALIKKRLENRLNKNTRQIQITAKLNNVLVKQQIKLEERIQELDKTEVDEVPRDLKDRLAAFEQEMKALDTEISQNTKGLLTDMELSESLDSSTTPTPKEKSRREKNKERSSRTDIELAEKIGQDLVNEVRRLKEKVKELEMNKAELEHNVEVLTGQTHSKEEDEDFIVIPQSFV